MCFVKETVQGEERNVYPNVGRERRAEFETGRKPSAQRRGDWMGDSSRPREGDTESGLKKNSREGLESNELFFQGD